MSEVIVCPRCQRRLRLPADFQADLARCPSCKETFLVASASSVSSLVQTTLPPPRRQPAAADRTRTTGVGRRSWNPCLIVAVVLGAVLLIMVSGVAALVAIVWRIQPQTKAVVPLEVDEEAGREQLRQALKDRKPLTEDEIAQQVKPLFDELSAALRAQNSGPLMAKFDLDRMIDELAAAGGRGLPMRTAKERRDFRRGVGLGLGMTLSQRGQVFHWDATEIRKVKKLDNDEAVVVARHKHPGGATLKLRWWVTRRNGPWQIYDFEDLDAASRVSSEMAAILAQAPGRAVQIGQAVKTIGEAIQEVALENVDGAEQKLAQVQAVQLPPRFEAMRQLAQGMVFMQRAKYRDALKALEEAHRLQPDLPLADFLQGVALNRLGKPDKALKHLRAYRDLLGADTEVCREMADILRAQGRFKEAIKEYRTALDSDPKNEELFTQLASLLFQEKQDDQLQKLLDARAKDFPDSIEAAGYRVRLLIRRNKTAQAIAMFKSVLAKTKGKNKRSPLVSQFLWDMQAAGKMLEGYRAAPDAVAAFRQLASGLTEDERWDDLTEDERWDDLRRLLEAHRAGHADDPWLAYYQAAMYQHEKAWDKAAKVLGEALKRDPKAARERIQSDYVFVLYKTGRWQEAYAEIKPHDETFTQLANLMTNDKKGAELEALVRVHKPHAGDSPDVPYYEARAKVLTKKWAESIPLFRQAYQKQADEALRTGYQASFLLDLAAEGRWLEGYRAAMDKSAALDTLGEELLTHKKDKELAALLEEHRKGGGGEPWYSFYLGELHLLRGDARQAARYFAAALTKSESDDQWRMRDGLFRARVRAGEAVIAYEEYKADEETFESLARLCSQNKDGKQLQALLDAHRRDEPDDPSLVSWELELLWLKQDYEGALRLWTQHRDDVFIQPRFRGKADELRVRCLVKLKRHAEAVRAAEEIVAKHSGDPILLVLAYAAAGDVPQTIAAMEKRRKDAFFVRRCYEYADLGPILRSKEFQAFRIKFPEPKEDKAAPSRARSAAE